MLLYQLNTRWAFVLLPAWSLAELSFLHPFWSDSSDEQVAIASLMDRDAMYATRGPAPPSCLAHLPGLTLHCLEFTSLYFPAQGRAVLPGPLAPGPGHMTSSSQWVISKIIGTPAWLGQRAASMGIFQNSLLPLTWPSGSQPAQKYKGCPAKFELHVNMPFQILHESYLY